MTRDIPSSQWRDFFDEFNRTHRAWRATVESAVPGDGVRVRAVERPLHSVSSEMEADGVARLDIRFQFETDADSPQALQIAAPIALRVDETAEGIVRGLHVIDETGGCTRVRFRTPPHGEMLDGIAPGELGPQP